MGCSVCKYKWCGSDSPQVDSEGSLVYRKVLRCCCQDQRLCEMGGKQSQAKGEVGLLYSSSKNQGKPQGCHESGMAL